MNDPFQSAPTFDRKFEANLENVSKVVRELADFCLLEVAGENRCRKSIDHLELSVCEALTNVVRHAYDGVENGTIAVCCRKQRGKFVVLLEDCGKPMPADLLSNAAFPSAGLDLRDLPEGGMGSALIFELMDEVTYERIDRTNQLTLKQSIA